MRKKDQYNRALGEWRQVLSNKSIIADRNSLSKYEGATYSLNRRIDAVIIPEGLHEVIACVKIANANNIPIYTISKGKNWGYGSSVPSSEGCTLMDLSKLNKVVEYNDKHGYIVVEPGVTFQQVYDFLENMNSNFIAPFIGGSPQASLVGNALERGIGKGECGDRFQNSCNMEVVLANGTVIKTGFGNMGAKSQDLFKFGVGPAIDGLFTQSNLGIVTRMTFWLTVKPKYFQAYFYTLKNKKKLPDVINALQMLRLEGTLNTTSTLTNDYRVLSMSEQYPWQDMKGNVPLERDVLNKRTANILGGARWIGDDAILSASKEQGRAIKKRIKSVLGPHVDKLVFLNKNNVRLMEALKVPISFITKMDISRAIFFFKNSMYLGVPALRQAEMCYYRKKTKIPESIDLDRDQCGLIWCSPTVPFDGYHVEKALEILYKSYEKYGFEPNLGMNFITNRTVLFIAAIIYDREEPGQDEHAQACYTNMLIELKKRGYVSYRSAVSPKRDGWLAGCSNTEDEEVYYKFLNKIKSALDPNNILSPGRYGMGSSSKELRGRKKDVEPNLEDATM